MIKENQFGSNMKRYQATIYQLNDALKAAQENNHIDLIFAIESMINVLNARINLGDDIESQEVM